MAARKHRNHEGGELVRTDRAVPQLSMPSLARADRDRAPLSRAVARMFAGAPALILLAVTTASDPPRGFALADPVKQLIWLAAAAGLLFWLWRMLERALSGAAARGQQSHEEDWNITDDYPYCTEPPSPEEWPLDLSEPLDLSLGLLRQLEWKRLEELVQAWYQAQGVEVQLTHTGVIGGARLLLYRAGVHRPYACVACSPALDPTQGGKRVREMRAAMAADRIEEGVIISAGQIGAELRAQAAAVGIQCLDGADFVEAFTRLRVEERDRILRQVTRGDYRTPTCPNCQVKMVLRNADKKNVWSCPNFPRCQRKMVARSVG